MIDSNSKKTKMLQLGGRKSTTRPCEKHTFPNPKIKGTKGPKNNL